MRCVKMCHVVADTTKVRIFKQITTQTSWYVIRYLLLLIPQRYEFSSKSQHGETQSIYLRVVADTTKVRIFKQITTGMSAIYANSSLLLIPQRYEFSSKSQRNIPKPVPPTCCCWYHKGTNFQANHNYLDRLLVEQAVVADTTKVRIFKQITTKSIGLFPTYMLLLIPQRYEFSSKSQRVRLNARGRRVVADTTKVRIFKQITT